MKKKNLHSREITISVGKQIRKRRVEIGLTQEQLAERLNISYQQIQKYETATNRVSASQLYLLAEELDVAVSYFFEGVDGGDNGAQEHGGKNRQTLSFVRNFTEIQEPELKAVVGALVKSLAGRRETSARKQA